MAVVYSQAVINARLQGDVTALGSNANLLLKDGSTLVSTIQLASPVGTVNGGILTFSGQLTDPAAAATGDVDTAYITDSSGAVAISGLTVGIPLSGADIIIANGLNSTVISSGQTVALLSAQITGS